MIYASDFVYNGASLSSVDPDLVIADFDDDTSGEAVIKRTVNRSSITYDEPFTHDYGVVDSDVYKITLTLIDNHDAYLTQDRVNALVSWLFSPKEPMWLSFYLNHKCLSINQMYEGLCYIGRFVSMQYVTVAEALKVGVTLEFECSSPYPYSEEIEYEFEDGVQFNVLHSGTHIGKSITPMIYLDPVGAGDVTIQNFDDASQGAFIIHADSTTTIKIENFNTFLLDDSDGSWDLLPFDGHVLNYNWPMILDGNNRFVINGASGKIVTRFYLAFGV